MTSYQMSYLGFATVDKRLSNPMLPWIIAQIKRGGANYEVRACLAKCCLELRGAEKQLSQPLSLVARLGVYPEGEGGYLVYALRDRDQPLLYCHLLHSTDIHDLLELMASMKEQQSRLKTPTSLCPDISPSSSHFFEVLYIGRIKVSHKKVPDTFIDEALDRFKIFEKQRKERVGLSQDEVGLMNGINNKASLTYSSSEGLKSEEPIQEKTEHEVILGRRRSGSVGTVITADRKQETGGHRENLAHDHNRTMVFHVGRTDLRLISPDRKQVLLHKHLRDISSSLQGCKHSSHFAFICKEPSSDNSSNYVGYVFKCESSSIAEDIVSAISQATVSEKKTSVVSCESCPMVWYHRVCCEIEAAGPNNAHEALKKRLDSLPQEEAAIVKTKLEGGGAGSTESIEITMMLLRAHCEAKQARHIHDTLEARHEFLSHYLGGNAIFMKAKRSLTSSFDQLLKRKGSRDDMGHHSLSLPPNASLKDLLVDSPAKNSSETDSSEDPGTPGSMMNIFMKLGKTTPKTPDELRPRSWRQAIFNNVVTPSKAMQKDAEKKIKHRDRTYYKELWKKAINQQVLLIRMEKENAQLTARQEEATVKRIKLEYEEVGSLGSSDVWDNIIKESEFPTAYLKVALKNAIPKQRRGEMWLHLAETFATKCSIEIDKTHFPNYDVPYEDLLKQLTSHQHAILIDLGRTFPNHPYYSSPLGPGQLSLFNILKAYSLIDPSVGYCQGLSFTAGVLLLHMPEADAFYLLRHLMFCRGLRERYLPDMSALQVCLYQLSRLLHDLHPDLYAHFDNLDIAPSLYAAPWLLTIFSSQFSLGFVARIFDLIFGDSPQVLFKVAIALLGHHKEDLLACDSFEEVMDYLKIKLPCVSNDIMDALITEVLETDVSRELKDYGVEYHVLEEEMSSPRPEIRRIKELESVNHGLADQVASLKRQIQMAVSDSKRLENTRAEHVSQLSKMDSELEEAKDTIKSLKSDLNVLTNFIAEILESDSSRSVPTNIIKILKQHNVNLLPKNKAELKSQASCPELKTSSISVNSQTNNIGRMLTEDERKALVESRKGALQSTKKPVQSAFELGIGSKHPLDSDQVATSFEGTIRLKSIPPALRRSETVTYHPSFEQEPTKNRSQFRRAETAELRIIEPQDIVSAKIQSTKDKVSKLFEFEKPFGKETQMLIKSQALHKQNGFLT